MQINLFTIFIVALLSFLATTVFTGTFIPILENKQLKQFVKENGPQTHKKKGGTPTMGGIPLIMGLIVGALVSNIITIQTAVLIGTTLLFALIGYIDDKIKVSKKQNLGFRAWQKLLMQFVFSAAFAVYMAYANGTEVWVPFVEGGYVDFGMLYIPFVIFVMIAMTNSVNLTDGLDGLASGVTGIVALFLAIMGMGLGANAPTAYAAALVGACLGFLVFNKYPAKLFMGDTGSMALGGAVAAIAIMLKIEFLLVVAGFIYVVEAVSVILQVAYYKKTKKRIFKMAPIHHHFEMCGMKETKVVLCFYAVTAVCCVIGYLIFNI